MISQPTNRARPDLNISASHEVIGFVKVQLLQLGFIEHKAPCEIKSRQRQVAHSEIGRPVLTELAGIPHVLIPPGFVEVESVDIREIENTAVGDNSIKVIALYISRVISLIPPP